MPKPDKFFDFNQLPQEEGLLVLPVSLSKTSNIQDPEHCVSYLKHFYEKISRTEGIGVVFVYSDYLYLLTPEENINTLHDRYLNQMSTHRKGVRNEIDKTHMVPQAMTFLTWGQMVTENRDFMHRLDEITQFYKNNKKLQTLVSQDAKDNEITNNQRQFILEECLFCYLLHTNNLNLPNNFLRHPQWVLQCYPGPPLQSETYIFQNDPLELKGSQNYFEDNYYDLKGKLLYEYKNIDLDNFPSHV